MNEDRGCRRGRSFLYPLACDDSAAPITECSHFCTCTNHNQQSNHIHPFYHSILSLPSCSIHLSVYTMWMHFWTIFIPFKHHCSCWWYSLIHCQCGHPISHAQSKQRYLYLVTNVNSSWKMPVMFPTVRDSQERWTGSQGDPKGKVGHHGILLDPWCERWAII